MNVRLTSNDMRFRLTNVELATLASGQTLTEALAFADSTLVLSISRAADDSPTHLDVGPWRVHLSAGRDDLEALAAAGRSKRGIERRFGAVTVALQVDIRSRS